MLNRSKAKVAGGTAASGPDAGEEEQKQQQRAARRQIFSQEEQAAFDAAMREKGSVTNVELAAMKAYMFHPHTESSTNMLLKVFSTGRAANAASTAMDAAMNVGVSLVHDVMRRRYKKRHDDAVRKSAVSDARAQEAIHNAYTLDIIADYNREKERRSFAKLQACERLYLDEALPSPSFSPSKRCKMHDTAHGAAFERISTGATPPTINLTADSDSHDSRGSDFDIDAMAPCACGGELQLRFFDCHWYLPPSGSTQCLWKPAV